MGKSPAHYKQAVDEDIGSEIGRYTKERGTALHALVLGGPKVIKYDEKQRRGSYWEEFQKKHPADAHILTAKEFEKTHRMALNILASNAAKPILRGAHEAVIDWNWCGRDCQSHVDILGTEHIAELKTCESAEPERFKWQSLRLGYHAQLAFYRMAAYATGKTNRIDVPCYIIAVESKPPYPVTLHKMSEELLYKGEIMCRGWMERLIQCEESGDWPGYSQAITEMTAPQDDPELIYPDEETPDNE